MINAILSYLSTHTFTTVAIIGSLVGTLISYIAPDLTTSHLCAGKGMRIGNLGIYSFVHENWGHLIGNLIFLIPGCMMAEALFGNKINRLVIIIILVALISEVPTFFTDTIICGSSIIAIMLFEMGLVWYGYKNTTYGIWLFIIAGINVVSYIAVDIYNRHNYGIGHIIGLASGIALGVLFGKNIISII